MQWQIKNIPTYLQRIDKTHKNPQNKSQQNIFELIQDIEIHGAN